MRYINRRFTYLLTYLLCTKSHADNPVRMRFWTGLCRTVGQDCERQRWRKPCACVVYWPIASVSQRSDDQPRCVAEILVAVDEFRCDHLHHDVFLVPVISHLTQPRKVVRVWHFRINHGRDDISRCTTWPVHLLKPTLDLKLWEAVYLSKKKSITIGNRETSTPNHKSWPYIYSWCMVYTEVTGPRVWNRLPVCLRSEDISYRQFRQQLKSCLFMDS